MDPRRERTQSLVLVAGRDLFAEEGLDAVTYSRIANRSGVGRRTLYRHWPHRAELIRDVLGGTSFATWRPTNDLRSDVRTHLEQLRAALVDGPLATIVLTLGERGRRHPDVAELRDRLMTDGCAPLRELLLRAAADGELAPDAPSAEILAAELEGPLFHLACLQGRAPDDALLDDLVARLPLAAGDRRR